MLTKKFTHNKTGKLYFVMMENVLNCTNAQANEEQELCIYCDQKKFYAREKKEFFEKFTEVPSSEKDRPLGILFGRNDVVKFTAKCVWEALNPESKMCIPNAMYIKIEELLAEYIKNT